MADPTLRDLAQAVDDSAREYVTRGHAGLCVADVGRDLREAQAALADALDLDDYTDATDVLAASLLAALDAERAQGYARAMGEVEARCEAEAAGACPGDDAHGALHAVAEWVRERLPAEAEKERGA